jgi:hypothetical protein
MSTFFFNSFSRSSFARHIYPWIYVVHVVLIVVTLTYSTTTCRTSRHTKLNWDLDA